MKQKNKHRGGIILKIYYVSTELQTDVGGGDTKNGWVKIKDTKGLGKRVIGYITYMIHTRMQKYQWLLEVKIICSNGMMSYRVGFEKTP